MKRTTPIEKCQSWELVALAQAKATINMDITALKKKILEDQSAMALFALPNNSLLIVEAWEYFTLLWYEKLNKI